jgi:predicted nucleic acid-binding protein
VKVLLDTNVVAELVRARPEPRVTAFLQRCDDPLLSAIAIHELAYSVERLRNVEQRSRLNLFLQSVKAMFEGRIVALEAALVEEAGRLRARASRSGWVLSQFDSLVAATAIAEEATLATRHDYRFERLGLPLVNPWEC